MNNVTPQKAFTEAEIREVDRATIQERGIPGWQLMADAGASVWKEAAVFDAPRVAVFCGKGNNGGDGYVVARMAHEAGRKVSILLIADPDSIGDDARIHFDRLPHSIRPRNAASLEECRRTIGRSELVIDAIFGVGIRGPLRAPFDELVGTINEAAANGIPVVAVDIPSGVPADPYPPGIGPAVRAMMTVTIGGPKLGMLVEPGIQYTGTVRIAPISFPTDLLNSPEVKGHTLGPRYIASLLPPRKPDSHKGSFGRTLLVAGSVGLGGAAILAAMGALRSGVGLTYLALPEPLYPAALTAAPEAISLPVQVDDEHSFAPTAATRILKLFPGWTRPVVIGPGIGRRPATLKFVRQLLAGFDAPVILDADGIHALAGNEEIAVSRSAPVAITPHPGELADLLGVSTTEIQSDRIGHATRTAARLNCHVLLKGAQSIIASPDGNFFINPTGNTGLAKGGSGDVLTGLIAGLAAQGIEMSQALQAGAFLHGLSADLAVESSHARSLLASEVAAGLFRAFRHLDQHR